MKRVLFVDRLFPTRSRSRVPGPVYLPYLWGRTFSIHGVVLLTFTIGLVFTGAGAASAGSWETSTMRAPGGGLVRFGMSRQEVLKELGEPLRTSAAGRSATTNGKTGRKNSAWTYRGDDGLYTITFSGEQVVRIVVTPDRD